ncbi:MAG: MFS transporter [Pseudonocardia sp.]|nr:MFS transporter [Pseudonocardia sp.]
MAETTTTTTTTTATTATTAITAASRAPDLPPVHPARSSASRSEHPNPTLLLAVMGFALALVIGANSSLSVAQPDIARALGATQTQLTWVVNSYALAFAALLLPAGIAADKYGRRTALLVGLTVFGAASAASGFAGETTTLITLRVVAGVGATLVMPATLSVLVDSFPPQRREFAVSVWAGITGAGALIGVLASGLLLNSFWWGSIQVVYGAAALIVLPLVLFVVPNTRNPRLPLDPAGGLWAAVGLAGLVFGLIEGPDQGWGKTSTMVGLVGGALALIVFVLVELRSAAPMLDVRLFRSPGLAAGSLLVTLLSVAVFGFFLIGPQYLQFINGYDTLQTAVRLLPFAVGIGPGSQLSPRLVARWGARWVGAGGAALMGVGLLVLAVAADHHYPTFVVGLILTAAGMGLALPAGTTLIINGLPPDRRTLSSAVNDVTRETGSAIGAAVFGSLLLAVYRGHVEPALGGLPATAADDARDGLAGAVAVSPGTWPASRALVPASVNGFTAGFQAAMLVGAAILFGTALLTALIAPNAGTQPAAPRNRTAAGRRTSRASRVVAVLGVVGALAGTALVVARSVHDARTFVATDNAQIDGEQITINAPATGTLIDWRATRGAQLRRNAPVGRIKIDDGFTQPQMIIRAPHDGVVAVDNGLAGSFVTAGTQLALAYDLNAGIYVTARVDETDIDAIVAGQPVDIVVDAYPQTPLTGRVLQIQGGTAAIFSPFVPANTTTDFEKVNQFVAVKIAIDDTRHHLDLLPGMNVTATIRRR